MQELFPHLSGFLLALTSFLALANLVHSIFYLKATDAREGGEHMPHWVYYTCFAAFYGAMVFALTALSLPLMWVAVELTTLVSAPLIAYHRSPGALEAMWKYLLICSIGIGLALFGTMLVLHAQTTGNAMWFKAGFVFVLAGYGTKTGLAPFHTWLPDAHSEAPAPVSAMLSGALLNCSLFAILRFYAVMPPEVLPFCHATLLALGFLSVAVAAIFMVRQTDFKRLLAYSSIEHMGLLVIIFATIGLLLPADPKDYEWGCDFLYFAFLTHLATHSLTKSLLFQTAGNLLLAFRTRVIAAVQGLGVSMKGHATLWLVGLLFICGMPPALLFFTELTLVCVAPLWIAVLTLVLLFIVFTAMTRVALAMVMGKPTARPQPLPRRLAVIPAFLAILVASSAFLLLFAGFFSSI